MLKPVETAVKDKKIKVFEIVRHGNTRYRRYHKANGVESEYWAHYRTITGREYVGTNIDTLRRQAVYTINYHHNIEEGMYIEDILTGRIYVIKYIDRKEGYIGDLALSVLEAKDVAKIAREPEVENGAAVNTNQP